jgi:serine/threonine-protein kinase
MLPGMSDAARLNAALEGRYAIERELGEGGMATVYLAKDLKHNRNVALKVLRPELAAVVGAERFLAEIETTANLQHPHILPLFDSGEADGFLFYVMPYVEGETLQDRIDRERQLPVDEAVRIATAVANALQMAHEQGIIHRDIKPANILLSRGEPLVADFGIALAVGAAGSNRLTETGLSLGTPYYMSPEQATGDQLVGASTDTYALSSVLYEMLVGDPPYPGSTAQAVLGKIIAGKPVSATEHRPSIPANVDAAVRKGLEKLPADRFTSAQEFARALGDPAFRYGEEAVVGIAPSTTGLRTMAVAATVVAIAAIGTAAVMAVRGPAEEPDRPSRLTLVSSLTGDVRPVVAGVAISRDGRDVVFKGLSQGQVRLYRRSLERPEIRVIPGTEGLVPGSEITLSPDGRSVAFWGSDGLVRRVSIDGGVPLPVANAEENPIGLSWSSEFGVVMGMFAFTDLVGLYRAEASDTAIHVIADPGVREGGIPEGMHHDPYVLEGDRAALYVDWDADRRTTLAIISLGDGSTERFDLQGSTPRGAEAIVGVADGVLLYIDAAGTLMAMAWDDDGLRPRGAPIPVPGVPTGMAYGALAPDGTLAMVVGTDAYEVLLVDDRGNPLLTLSEERTPRAFPRFSPDGLRIAVATQFVETGEMAQLGGPGELWTYDIEADLLSQLAMGIEPRAVAWTSDSERVLATIGFDRQNLGEIWSRPADASDEASVLAAISGLEIWGLDLSPDGRVAALASTVSLDPYNPVFDIVIAGLEGDTPVEPFAAGEASEVAPRFSPNGRWLAYASNETDRYQVYVRPFPGPGPRIQISNSGGGQPVWSANGDRLFYRTERAIMVADIAVDGSGESLSVTAREQLFEGDFFGTPAFSTATYDVHPDGQRFVLARAVSGSGTEIVLWMDWLQEVKERLGN